MLCRQPWCYARVRYLSNGQEWSEQYRIQEQTRVVKYKLNPVWNEKFLLPVRRCVRGVFSTEIVQQTMQGAGRGGVYVMSEAFAVGFGV